MRFTFPHKDGRDARGCERIFIAFSEAEAQHFAACHYDGREAPFISRWEDSEAEIYLDPSRGDWVEAFSGATGLHVWDSVQASKGSKVGMVRARQWWIEACKGKRLHAGYGSYANPSPIVA